MTTYNFTLFFEGPDLEDHLDALFDAGCDDALFGLRSGQQFAEFDRDAASFGDAVLEALRTLEATVPGLLVTRVEPDDLITQSRIAERAGRSRESIRLLIAGKRGPGDFPEPVGSIDSKTRIWRWSEVAEWFELEYGERVALAGAPLFTRTLNGVLEVRSQAKRLSAVAAQPDGRAMAPQANVAAEGTEESQKVAFTSEAVADLRSLVEESAELADRELAAV